LQQCTNSDKDQEKNKNTGDGGTGGSAGTCDNSSDPGSIVITGFRPAPVDPFGSNRLTTSDQEQLAQLIEFDPLIHLRLPPSVEDGILHPTRCACFEAGTLVATPRGLRPIEDIKVGDSVFSENTVSGKIAAKKVIRLIRPKPKPIYELVLRDHSNAAETFHVTGDHRWLSDATGWVSTDELKIGQRIVTGSKADVIVASVSLTNIVESTYNLEVADWHTFLVGKDRAVVHNGDCSPDLQNLQPAGSNKRANEIARQYGYKDAHDAKDGRGSSRVDIYVDKSTGQAYLWNGNKNMEPEPL
jgi:hypothetical protein